MIVFWLTAGAMVAVALAFVIPALAGRARSSSVARKQLNISIHKERLQELETELQNGVLSQDQFEQARAELQRNLLRDVEGDDDTPSTAHPPRLLGAIVAAVAIPALAIALYLTLGDPQSIHVSAQALAESGQQQTTGMHSIEQMVQQLRDKLQREPDNVEGWLLLGRSYMTQQHYGEAVAAYARAYELKPNDAQLMADYAEAMALANGSRLEGQPTDLAARALKLEPDNPKALWLSGMAAMQRGEREVAVAHLQRLQKLLPPGSEGSQLVRSFLEQAMGNATTTPEPSRPAPPSTAATAGGTRLEVKVALDPALAARAAPKDTVFIYAQASQGPRMPLAIVRRQVQALPATVVLDDSMAMTPAMKLSQFDKVVIGARISKSGIATPQSGDLEGRSGVITLDTTKSVNVIINRAVP
jgi:cytochrome c-type biogenesis protein CcmH